MEQLLDAAIAARVERVVARRVALGAGRWKGGFIITAADASHREGAGVYCLCDDCDDARAKARKGIKKQP